MLQRSEADDDKGFGAYVYFIIFFSFSIEILSITTRMRQLFFVIVFLMQM